MEYPNKTNKWRRGLKAKCVLAMGGKCQSCGYNKCNRALEFHHLDRKSKDFNISKLFEGGSKINVSSLVDELKKCAMLCSNCHKELHDGVIMCNFHNLLIEAECKKIFSNLYEFNPTKEHLEELFKNNKNIKDVKCELRCTMGQLRSKIMEFQLYGLLPNREYVNKNVKISKEELLEMINNKLNYTEMGNKYGVSSSTIKYKLKKLGLYTNSKVAVEKNKLEELVNSMPLTKVGKMFNVSDNAVRKRCKVLNVSIPKFPRGYWLKK